MNHRGRSRQIIFSTVLFLLLFIPLTASFAPEIRAANARRQGNRAAQDGNFQQAAANLAQAAAYRPEEAGLWEAAGQYAFQAGDPFTAIHYLQRATTLGGISKGGLVTYGEAYEQTGDLFAANLAWEAASKADPTDVIILERLLSNYLAEGNLPATRSVLRRIIAIQPGNSDAYLQLGLITAAIEPDSSLAYLAEAAAIDADLEEISENLEATIRRARLIDDDPAYLAVAVGRSLASIGAWDLAQTSFRNAIRINPEFADAWAFLAEANQQVGDSGGTELQEAYRLNPESSR